MYCSLDQSSILKSFDNPSCATLSTLHLRSELCPTRSSILATDCFQSIEWIFFFPALLACKLRYILSISARVLSSLPCLFWRQCRSRFSLLRSPRGNCLDTGRAVFRGFTRTKLSFISPYSIHGFPVLRKPVGFFRSTEINKSDSDLNFVHLGRRS